MDFMLFMLHFLSYTMLAYFVFQIFGRRRNISIIVLAVLLGMSLLRVINFLASGEQILSVILLFITDTLPIVLGLLLFLYLTRAYASKIRFRKERSLKLKKLYTTVLPSKYIKQLSISGNIVSAIVLLLAISVRIFDFTVITDFLFVITIVISSLSLVYTAYQIYMSRFVEKESFLIYVGKQKENCYSYDMKQIFRPITIEDIYKNSDFIIDEIGFIRVYEQHRLIEKYYLYWIATSQDVQIKEEHIDKVNVLFKDYVDDISKYQKVNIRLKLERGQYELISKK